MGQHCAVPAMENIMPVGPSMRTVDQIKAATPSPITELAMLYIKNNMSMADLARRIGKSREAVYCYISGQYSPRPEVIEEIKAAIAEIKNSK